MGLFDDPVGYLNGGLYGPAGKDLTSYLGNVLSGQYALQGIQGANDAFRNNDYGALAGMFGPGAIKTPKLDRIGELTADRVSGELGGQSAGSPVSSFSAIQAADTSPRGYEIQKSGQPIGTMDVSFPKDPANAYVDYIGAWGDGSSANALGPRAVRDVGRQFFQADPAIQSLTGRRVSGARDVPADVTVTRDQALPQGASLDPSVIELIRKYGLGGLTAGAGATGGLYGNTQY